MRLLQTIFFVPLVILVVGATLWWSRSQSMTIIRKWAQENGYEVVSAEPRNILRGPFWFRSAKNQTVYYITVRDRAGAMRRGWVRCGSWLLGLLNDAVTVKWEE